MADISDLKSDEVIPHAGSSPASGTICVSCRKELEVKEYKWIEPRSEKDSRPVTYRGFICDDCAVIHWASPVSGITYNDLDRNPNQTLDGKIYEHSNDEKDR